MQAMPSSVWAPTRSPSVIVPMTTATIGVMNDSIDVIVTEKCLMSQYSPIKARSEPKILKNNKANADSPVQLPPGLRLNHKADQGESDTPAG